MDASAAVKPELEEEEEEEERDEVERQIKLQKVDMDFPAEEFPL